MAYEIFFFCLLLSANLILAASVDKRELLFAEEFNSMEKWKHVVTAYQMGENEFQYYSRQPENSFIKDGKLFIKPTLTAERFGEDFLHNGKFSLKEEGCNLAVGGGCVLQSSSSDIANPIQSAALVSTPAFAFTYGTVEIRAKMPRGDWLWPEISLIPTKHLYGEWPRSGYITLAAIRGNNNYYCQGKPMGNTVMESSLEWGIDELPGRTKSFTWIKELGNNASFSSDFHDYRLEWTSSGIHTFVDGQLVGSVEPPAGGFWEMSRFNVTENLWMNGSAMAPFDQEFFISLEVAVGGDFFPDDCENLPYPQPWKNSDPKTSMSSFWEKRNEWYPTWLQDDSALQVDYIRVYAPKK